MRLNSVLSKPPSKDYVQVDHFLLKRQGNVGQQVDLNVGKVGLNYHCLDCDDLRSFTSKGKISCIFVNKKIISIDTVLSCDICKNDIQIWFLVESKGDIRGYAPKVRIIKRSERLPYVASINTKKYSAYAELLDKAEKAYREDLGAGAIVYLRKAFEQITVDTAKIAGINYETHKNGNPKNFFSLLKKVDNKCRIIPVEFTINRYKLFKELSDIVHGGYNDDIGIRKFESLYRLVIGILENVKNREELYEAIDTLGWENEGSVEVV